MQTLKKFNKKYKNKNFYSLKKKKRERKKSSLLGHTIEHESAFYQDPEAAPVQVRAVEELVSGQSTPLSNDSGTDVAVLTNHQKKNNLKMN